MHAYYREHTFRHWMHNSMNILLTSYLLFQHIIKVMQLGLQHDHKDFIRLMHFLCQSDMYRWLVYTCIETVVTASYVIIHIQACFNAASEIGIPHDIQLVESTTTTLKISWMVNYSCILLNYPSCNNLLIELSSTWNFLITSQVPIINLKRQSHFH